MTPHFSDSRSQPFLPFYEVLEPLGEGAVASVYKVRTRKDGSVRALKALKPEQGETARGIERFEDEFRILSALNHPSLPQVFDYGRGSDGRWYMVMELLEGEPLDRYAASHKDDLWLLLFQLNEALAFIHEHGLLHLDLKPGNVLVRRTRGFSDEEMPLLMLIDFGLSYRRESGSTVKLVGTPGYMAPEVIRGEDELTRAADYYSTGVIIYELVQGRLPFEGSMEDILRAHLTRHVTFAQRRVEYTELYPWIEALMAKEPGERLAAFQEFRRLMAARQGGSIEALQRAYALGYIDSLGLIGKDEVWKKLDEWAVRLRAELAVRGDVGGTARAVDDAGRDAVVSLAGQTVGGAGTDVTGPEPRSADAVREDTGRDETEDTVGRIIKGSVANLEEKIRQDLLKSAASAMESYAPIPLTPVAEVARVVTLSGPPESGKTYLLRAFRHALKLKNVNVVALGEESDYRNLVAPTRGPKKPGAKQGVDPGSIAIDRFAAGWDRLCQMGKEGGVVLLVDDCRRLDQEEWEFLQYVGKRVGMAVAEGNEVGVFVVAIGKRGEVRKALPSLVSDERGFERVEVPPPSKLDADAITETFRGHLSGRREQESLAVFLKENLGTGGALYTALRQIVADGDLYYEGGMWHFTEPRGGRISTKDTAGAYSRGLVDEFNPGARALLPWLVCHP
ncbi:MAG: protein kinase, partial [bacterium]